MNRASKLAIAAVAVVAVGILGIYALDPGGVGRRTTPAPTLTSTLAPTPSGTATSAPTSTGAISLTQSFTSTTNGFSISYPAGWQVRPATEPWMTGIPFGGSLTWDNFNDGSTSHFVGVASQPLAGLGFDQWAAQYVTHADWGDTCAPGTESVTIDGTIGLLAIHCPDDDVFSAFVAAADRGYIVVGLGLPSRAHFAAILETLRLSPQIVRDTVPSPSP
jgi:hypothetical protein